MSIEQIFESSEKKKKIKALAAPFDSILSQLTALNIQDEEGIGMKTSDIQKHLVKVYQGRRDLIAGEVDLEAEVTIAPKVKRPRKPKEATAADASAASTETQATALEPTPKATNGKAGKGGNKKSTDGSDME